VGTETAARHLNAQFAQSGLELAHQGLRYFGWSGVDEAGAAPTTSVREERELAYDQRLAAYVQQREIEAPFAVLEDAHLGSFRRQPTGLTGRVASRHAQQDEQAATYRADRLTVNDN